MLRNSISDFAESIIRQKKLLPDKKIVISSFLYLLSDEGEKHAKYKEEITELCERTVQAMRIPWLFTLPLGGGGPGHAGRQTKLLREL